MVEGRRFEGRKVRRFQEFGSWNAEGGKKE
jgi:hypothetical protein